MIPTKLANTFTALLNRSTFRCCLSTASVDEGLSYFRLQQAYSFLGVDDDSTVEEVKKRFAELAKVYHPDTGGKTADPAKFAHLRVSFKIILRNKTDVPTEDVDEVAATIEHDIRHTAPQHRQYLEYGGIGVGNPFSRQKQYQQYKVFNAVESATEFMLDKAVQKAAKTDNALMQLEKERSYFSKKHKLTGMIDRVVEELILSSMKDGNFSNLKGAGKPLKPDVSNPYIDNSERRINEILRNNGFAPPWIMKENEIREDVASLRKQLRVEYCRLTVLKERFFFGSKLSRLSSTRWQRIKDEAAFAVRNINRLILDFNLICPIMGRQVMALSIEKEIQEAVDSIESGTDDAVHLINEVREQLLNEQKRSHDDASSVWNVLKETIWSKSGN